VGRPDHLDDVYALPHQGLGSICARCSSSRALHESLEGDRVEHEIVRVQLDGDRDASFTGEGVDLLPLQHLQRAVADASRASTKMGGEIEPAAVDLHRRQGEVTQAVQRLLGVLSRQARGVLNFLAVCFSWAGRAVLGQAS
jgi:hypothetical protein